MISRFAASSPSRIAARSEASDSGADPTARSKHASARSEALAPPGCPPTPSATATTPRPGPLGTHSAASSLSLSL